MRRLSSEFLIATSRGLLQTWFRVFVFKATACPPGAFHLIYCKARAVLSKCNSFSLLHKSWFISHIVKKTIWIKDVTPVRVSKRDFNPQIWFVVFSFRCFLLLWSSPRFKGKDCHQTSPFKLLLLRHHTVHYMHDIALLKADVFVPFWLLLTCFNADFKPEMFPTSCKRRDTR